MKRLIIIALTTLCMFVGVILVGNIAYKSGDAVIALFGLVLISLPWLIAAFIGKEKDLVRTLFGTPNDVDESDDI